MLLMGWRRSIMPTDFHDCAISWYRAETSRLSALGGKLDILEAQGISWFNPDQAFVMIFKNRSKPQA
jgi:hypothetical protein